MLRGLRRAIEDRRAPAPARLDADAVDAESGAVADDVPDQSPAVSVGGAVTPRHVPYGLELAAGWSWRLLVIALAGYVVYRILSYFAEIAVPIAIAVLVSALLVPFVDGLVRLRVPRVLAALVVVVGFVAVVTAALTLVGQQVSTQVSQLRDSVVTGIGQVQDWARNGPLGLSDAQLQTAVDNVVTAIQNQDGQVVTRVTEVGATLTHVGAGVFIVLFGTYFFLYEGGRIWTWVVGLVPRDASEYVDSSGRVAWVSLTAFTRATVVVAFTDAVGIAVAAWILGVPLAFAIGVLVFIGAFIPIVGAFVSGLVAVLVALVDQGPVTALLMLLAVIVVQQIEAHVLQPFLMGRLVAVHPLAIILAVAAGIAVSGIVGALVAVPIAACVNAVVKHLASRARAQAQAGPARA
ncbi:AI-2E family transporter [Solicola sp. PLA-1-18]|uniref:AI-2E family transporter n=1 Tax=Solicola sp. PLA-1-18 TaxID=3380532 RepID=UPI003B7D52CF